jgi:hypothetical protein
MDQALAGTVVTPAAQGKAMPRKSVPVRAARLLYAALSTAFVSCVVVQVFFAGMGAFGADWDWHKTFVHLLELLALAMIPAALVARSSWGLTLLPFGLVFLIGVQYAFADSAVPAAALHPVNAVLIFVLSMGATKRAWAAVKWKG